MNRRCRSLKSASSIAITLDFSFVQPRICHGLTITKAFRKCWEFSEKNLSVVCFVCLWHMEGWHFVTALLHTPWYLLAQYGIPLLDLCNDHVDPQERHLKPSWRHSIIPCCSEIRRVDGASARPGAEALEMCYQRVIATLCKEFLGWVRQNKIIMSEFIRGTLAEWSPTQNL